MRFLNPFMAFTNEEVLSKQLVDCFKKEFHIPEAEVRDAVSEGWKELAMTRLEMQKKGEEVLKYMEEHHRRGIVLAGRPYHVDPGNQSRYSGNDYFLRYACCWFCRQDVASVL